MKQKRYNAWKYLQYLYPMVKLDKVEKNIMELLNIESITFGNDENKSKIDVSATKYKPKTIKATFKEISGVNGLSTKEIIHTLVIVSFITSRFNTIRKLMGKRVKVMATDVIVDGISIIDKKTGEFVEPSFYENVKKIKVF